MLHRICGYEYINNKCRLCEQIVNFNIHLAQLKQISTKISEPHSEKC